MTDNASRLKNFPIAWFSMAMGMAGFSIAWNRAEHVFDAGFCLSPVLLAFTTLLFVGMLLLLAAKLVKYPRDVLGEITHPVKRVFVPTISIGMLLLSLATLIMASETGLVFYTWLAAGLLGALSVLVLLLLARTALAVMRREICVEGH